MRLAIGLIVLLSAGAAHAQSRSNDLVNRQMPSAQQVPLTQPWSFSDPTPCPAASWDDDVACFKSATITRVSTGNPDLDRAIAICDRHSVPSGAVYAISPNGFPAPAWEPGWEKCAVVQSRWEDTDRARQLAAERKQESADLAFVNSFAQRTTP